MILRERDRSAMPHNVSYMNKDHFLVLQQILDDSLLLEIVGSKQRRCVIRLDRPCLCAAATFSRQ